jgi:cytoskeleton protein RodZ
MATVMASVGAYLRELRTRRGVSLDEVARLTRVAPRYLTALENDAFSELPAPVFIRGFIRAYCQAMGLSPDEALGLYDGHEGRAAHPVVPATAPPPVRSASHQARPRGTLVVSFVLLVILGMALFTVALVIRPGDRLERPVVEARRESLPAPPPPAAGSSEASSETVTSAPLGQPAPVSPPAAARPPVQPAPPASAAAPRPGTPAPQAARPVAPPQPEASPARPSAPPNLEAVVGNVSSPYRLIARTSESTWIRVRTDDGRSSDETIPAGEIREWVSNRPFTITVGNAGGVSFELNGRVLPPLGPRGVVIPRLVLPPESR